MRHPLIRLASGDPTRCPQQCAMVQFHWYHCPFKDLIHFIRLILMYYVNDRTSTCCDVIAVNPLTKVAVVRYNNGREYTYKNVSRRAIIKLMADRSVSLGFFANQLKKDAKNKNKKTYSLGQTGFEYAYNSLVTV